MMQGKDVEGVGWKQLMKSKIEHKRDEGNETAEQTTTAQSFR